MAVIILGDRFVLVPIQAGGESDGHSLDGDFNVALADVTSLPRFTDNAISSPDGGVTVTSGGLSVPGFEVVATLGAGGEVAGGGAGALRDPNLTDAGLVRENTVSFDGIRVIYRELIEEIEALDAEHTIVGTSYREFSADQEPTVVLLRRVTAEAPVGGVENEGGKNG